MAEIACPNLAKKVIFYITVYLDHTRFPDDTKCMISGWGDVNAEENGVQQPDMLQVAFVKIFNFEVSSLFNISISLLILILLILILAMCS